MNPDSHTPTQAECDHANALREYEAAHRRYMNTNVFSDAGKDAKRVLEEKRIKYLSAVKAVHPTWIVC